MVVDCDFSDVDIFFDSCQQEIREKTISVGETVVRFAVDNGNYNNQTGYLRASNGFIVESDGLTLVNEADYASEIEARGYDVLTGAALEAERLLNEW